MSDWCDEDVDGDGYQEGGETLLNPRCVEVPFTYPTEAVVRVVNVGG